MMEWAVVIVVVIIAASLLARRSVRYYKRSNSAGCPDNGCPMGCEDCAPAARLVTDIDAAREARRHLTDQTHAQGK